MCTKRTKQRSLIGLGILSFIILRACWVMLGLIYLIPGDSVSQLSCVYVCVCVSPSVLGVFPHPLPTVGICMSK